MSKSKPKDIIVSEIFTTFQGEGPSIGRRCTFLRLGGCNLQCKWCDTPYTWDWSRFDKKKELTKKSIRDVCEEIEATETGRLVISGGEPMLQQRAFVRVMKYLTVDDWKFEIETAGTIMPGDWPVLWQAQFNCSPKLEGSGNPLNARRSTGVLRALCGRNTHFKFVICDEQDVEEVKALQKELVPHKPNIWLMPEGRTIEEITEKSPQVIQWALENGWNFSTRLHVLVYGDKRGV